MPNLHRTEGVATQAPEGNHSPSASAGPSAKAVQEELGLGLLSGSGSEGVLATGHTY